MLSCVFSRLILVSSLISLSITRSLGSSSETVSNDMLVSVKSDLSCVSGRLGWPDGSCCSWLLSVLIGHLSRFLSSSSSLNSVSLELFMAAFRLAMSNSSNLYWVFFLF